MRRHTLAWLSRSSLSTTTRRMTRRPSSVVSPEPPRDPSATCSSARRACRSRATADCRRRKEAHRVHRRRLRRRSRLDCRALGRVRGRSRGGRRRRPRRLVCAGRSAGVDPPPRGAGPLYERDADLWPCDGMQSGGQARRRRTHRRLRSGLRRQQGRGRGRHRIHLSRAEARARHRVHPRCTCAAQSRPPDRQRVARARTSYVRGRGAFFCKHLLRADPTIARHAWWEVRAGHGRAPTSASQLSRRETLGALASGALHFILVRSGLVRP